MNTKILEELGLTKNEVKVYLALLELGSTPAGPLVKKLSMHRAAVYNLLDLLLDKGIISYVTKHNIKHFEAHDPERLLEYIKLKKQQLDEKEKKLKEILPELQLKKNIAITTQKATIFTGKRGIKSVLEDILKIRKPWLVFGAEGKFKDLFPTYFLHHHNQRAKLKIPLKIIFNEKLRKKRKSLPHAQIKFLSEKYLSPSTTYVYGDTIAIIIWNPEPMAFVIKSEQVASSYHSFFEVLWDTAKK
jgi:HTH-type transcriptional regulator, sugar sensing transcriptional regulator